MAGMDVNRVDPVEAWAEPLAAWLKVSKVSSERSRRAVLAFGRFSVMYNVGPTLVRPNHLGMPFRRQQVQCRRNLSARSTARSGASGGIIANLSAMVSEETSSTAMRAPTNSRSLSRPAMSLAAHRS